MADVKICGIATPTDFDACHDAGAAFVGMVFFPRSPRHLTSDSANRLANHADRCGESAPRRVALTVDMPEAEMADVVAIARPHIIQLHGNETPDQARAIKTRFGRPIIKAIRVGGAEDLAQSKQWLGVADWLLFDAKGDPEGLPGGTGHSFDWGLLDGQAGDTPWMLAGGLDSHNVGRAVGVTGAPIVDVSSGVESSPGQKDAALIRAFVSAAQIG